MPHLNLELLPIGEREIARQFNALVELSARASDFRTGLELFSYCSLERQKAHETKDEGGAASFLKWMELASRDCVMSIYHFGHVINGIGETLGKCPILKSKINPRDLRKANNRFSTRFSWCVHLRNALAHSAERGNTPRAQRRHSVAGPNKISSGNVQISVAEGDSVGMVEGLNGTTYYSMWGGKIYSCNITEETAIEIDAIKDSFLKVFSPITYYEPPPIVTFTDRIPPDATIISIT